MYINSLLLLVRFKMYAWEMKFLSKVIQLRKTEEIWLHKFLAGTAIIRFLFTNAPTFIAVVTFGACALIGIPLESGKEGVPMLI